MTTQTAIALALVFSGEPKTPAAPVPAVETKTVAAVPSKCECGCGCDNCQCGKKPAPKNAPPAAAKSDPFDQKNAAPAAPKTAPSEMAFARHGESPPAAPPGFVYVRVSCNQEGCNYRLAPVQPATPQPMQMSQPDGWQPQWRSSRGLFRRR